MPVISLHSRRIRQSGVAIVITAISVSLLLLFVAGALLLSWQATVKAQLQGAADAAALAAAGILGAQANLTCNEVSGGTTTASFCTARQRYGMAQARALDLLNLQKITNPNGPTVPLFTGTAANASDPKYRPYWQSSDGKTIARIERGRMLHDGEVSADAPPWTFQSLEKPFDEDHPGLPVFMAANAMRVTLERTGIEFPFGMSFFAPRSVTVSAVAFSGQRDAVPAVPLAIHVCSLISDDPLVKSREAVPYPVSGATSAPDTFDYHPNVNCVADRLFTAAGRYCPASDPNCGLLPGFSWDPVLPPRPGIDDSSSGVLGPDKIERDYWGKAAVRRLETPVVNAPVSSGSNDYPKDWFSVGSTGEPNRFDRACFWASPRYWEYGDNFGVFGEVLAPGATSGQTFEASAMGPITYDNDSNFIAESLEMFRGGKRSQIGGGFVVRPEGLTTADANTALWERIINCDFLSGGTLPSHCANAVAPVPLPVADPTPDHLLFRGPSGASRGAGLSWAEGANGDFQPNLNVNYAFANVPSGNEFTTPPEVYRCENLPLPAAPTARKFAPANSALRLNSKLISPTAPNIYQPKSAYSNHSGGTCNSTRSGWGHWATAAEVAANYPSTSSFSDGYVPPFVAAASPPQRNNNKFSTLPVWRVLVPVVADMRKEAQSCAWLPNPKDGTVKSEDPPFVADVVYGVIGHVQMDVFDVDIGRASPGAPAIPFPDLAPDSDPFYRQQLYYQDRTKFGNPGFGFRYPSNQDPSPTNGIDDHTYDQASCNLLRARMVCGQGNIPATTGGSGAAIEPVLISVSN